MDIFTMVITACVAGTAPCSEARFSETGFTSEAACEAAVDRIVDSMTHQFAADPKLKGKQVTYDVSCMSKAQMKAKLGVVSSDI
ncbi:hypothetical protein [Terrarubrum flagellatum]|uniref:hypothetical protein n=1 Tax=Terrirubrum flagellatum TaxID=2895980 RepID=UPI003144FF6E